MAINHLLLIPLVFAFLCGMSFADRRLIRLFFVGGTVLLAVSGWFFVFKYAPKGTVFALRENLMMDSLAALFVLLIVTLGLLSALYAAGYLFRKDSGISSLKLSRYTFFFQIFLFTMLLTVLSNNLGVMWIAIEGTTLASAFLVNVDDKKSSVEAAWKYLILCTVGIALALFGIVLVYYSAVLKVSGTDGNLLNWNFLLEKARLLDPQVMKLAFIFILVGYGTKAGLAPFHSWLPDAHSQAPSPVSALLSGVLLSCATFGIIRFHILTKIATASAFSANLLIFFGVVSVAVAVPFLLNQGDYKRLLAYSSVEHMGLAAVGIGFGGIYGIYGALLHIVNHAFNKSFLFFTAGHLLHQSGTKEIRKVRGLYKTHPFLGGMFFLGILAIAGMPPFGIFVSEFFIFTGGFVAKKFAVCGLLLLFLALIFTAFLRHAGQMTLGESEQPVHPEKSFLMDGVIWIGMMAMVVLGCFVPSPLQQLIREASRVIEGASL